MKSQTTYQSVNLIKRMDKKFLAAVIILVSVLISTIILLDYYYKNSDQNNFDLGFQQGTENGITIGYDDGHTQGYAQGVVSGSDDGYTQGEVAGFNDGYTQGEVAGFNDGYTQGEEAGYAKGLTDGIGTGYTIRDPTYQEMIDFISSDTTDQIEYTEDYVCYDFAEDLKNNAFFEGYRCAFVYVTFPDSDHGMVCFDTVDRGLIFIEPQFDKILTPVVGEPLFDRTFFDPGMDDTIVDYRIIW